MAATAVATRAGHDREDHAVAGRALGIRDAPTIAGRTTVPTPCTRF